MTYDWICKNHDKPRFQYTIQSMLVPIEPPACAVCEQVMERVFNAAPTHFKGGGWGHQ